MGIRTILKPFLMISYILGFRIDNSTNYLRLWFNVLYVLLVWSIYCFLSTSALISSFNKFISIEQYICYRLEIITTLLSIIFGIYHDKKFQNCLKKLDIVDNTLLKLGIMTDYDKLHKKTVWIVLGWFLMVILTICSTALYIKDKYDHNFATTMFYIFIRNYCFHINFVGDLTTATILEYIGLKFDQVNKHFQHLIKNNKHEIKRAWENSMINSHQQRFSKSLSNKCITWIVIHLHLELRKISREIDSVFGIQLTIKMICYFGWIVLDLRRTLYIIFIDNYMISKITSISVNLIWFCHNVFKFLLINYVYETVTTKASNTSDLLSKLSYSSYDVEIREIISHFLLQMTYAPLKFCGIGFFQFGFKFLRRFIMSIATVSVIILQSQANK